MRLADLSAWWSARRASKARPSEEHLDNDLLELLDEASSVFGRSTRTR